MTRTECETCDGAGVLVGEGGRYECVLCDGKGWIPVEDSPAFQDAPTLVRALAPVAEPFGVFNDDPSRRGAWIQTFTGRKFWPLDPRIEDFHPLDIAHALSMVCRYGGHTGRFYCVAEHAVIVSHYVPKQWRREALLHDLSEAYTGDMVRPLKYQPEMAEFRKAEHHIEAIARKAFGLSEDPECWAAVKEIDDRIIVDEVRDLMSNPPMYWTRHPDVKPLGVTIIGADPWMAEQWFLDEFRELFPEVSL